MNFPNKLNKKLEQRKAENSLRFLPKENTNKIDFSSNDYLGYAKDELLFEETHLLAKKIGLKNGATGSRLLSGNSEFYEKVEKEIANFHHSESALLYNSGYVANIGFFSCVPQRGDIVFYDELIHASIRDALMMSFAKSVKFKHNDTKDLERLIQKYQSHHKGDFYIVTESVFSMDGDSPDFNTLIETKNKYKAFLVIDEAHALGVFGEKGEGLIQSLGLENEVFTRIMTYGKALGGHGASILGSQKLKDYLINFSRSFIYTTALSPHSVAHIKVAYDFLSQHKNIRQLKDNIVYFNQKIQKSSYSISFQKSNSAIQTLLISGNERVKQIAQSLQKKGFDIKPILSPTVPKGKERLRITLHADNSLTEFDTFFNILNGISLTE